MHSLEIGEHLLCSAVCVSCLCHSVTVCCPAEPASRVQMSEQHLSEANAIVGHDLEMGTPLSGQPLVWAVALQTGDLCLSL